MANRPFFSATKHLDPSAKWVSARILFSSGTVGVLQVWNDQTGKWQAQSPLPNAVSGTTSAPTSGQQFIGCVGIIGPVTPATGAFQLLLPDAYLRYYDFSCVWSRLADASQPACSDVTIQESLSTFGGGIASPNAPACVIAFTTTLGVTPTAPSASDILTLNILLSDGSAQ
jgi:hypothetical protein